MLPKKLRAVHGGDMKRYLKDSVLRSTYQMK
jgi:hypothetical protein